MKRISIGVLGLAATVGLVCLIPAGASAKVATSDPGTCTVPTSPYTFKVTITLAEDGTPIASPSSNEDSTCVEGNDTITFDVSALPSGATWSASFPTPVAGGIFQNNCTFGNGSGQSSSCNVISSPPWKTYDYSVTVTANGVSKTLDPRVIIGKGTKKKHPRRHHRPQASPQP